MTARECLVAKQIWDNNPQALVYVVDAADRAGLTLAHDELAELLGHGSLGGGGGGFGDASGWLCGVPLLVLANKQDVAGAATPDEVAAALGLSPPPPLPREAAGLDATAAGSGVGIFLDPEQWRVLGVSASTGNGLTEAFGWLSVDMAETAALTGVGRTDGGGGEASAVLASVQAIERRAARLLALAAATVSAVAAAPGAHGGGGSGGGSGGGKGDGPALSLAAATSDSDDGDDDGVGGGRGRSGGGGGRDAEAAKEAVRARHAEYMRELN
ncbi:ADP-ribosylation factor protein 3, partial [Cladochytrium tenue]